jgi:ankyrin repeat protein
MVNKTKSLRFVLLMVLLMVLGVLQGDAKEVQKLLAMTSVDVNEPEQKSGNVALHCASAKGHLEVVRALLSDPRTNPNLENLHNTTALILAAGNANAAVVEELLRSPETNPNFEV